jgi:hypothetical protein
MSRGPQVADMECRETTWLAVSFCIDGDPSHHRGGRRFSDVIHHTSWLLEGSGPCSMRYKSCIMVSMISIFEAFEYVVP